MGLNSGLQEDASSRQTIHVGLSFPPIVSTTKGNGEHLHLPRDKQSNQEIRESLPSIAGAVNYKIDKFFGLDNGNTVENTDNREVLHSKIPISEVLEFTNNVISSAEPSHILHKYDLPPFPKRKISSTVSGMKLTSKTWKEKNDFETSLKITKKKDLEKKPNISLTWNPEKANGLEDKFQSDDHKYSEKNNCVQLENNLSRSILKSLRDMPSESNQPENYPGLRNLPNRPKSHFIKNPPNTPRSRGISETVYSIYRENVSKLVKAEITELNKNLVTEDNKISINIESDDQSSQSPQSKTQMHTLTEATITTHNKLIIMGSTKREENEKQGDFEQEKPQQNHALVDGPERHLRHNRLTFISREKQKFIEEWLQGIEKARIEGFLYNRTSNSFQESDDEQGTNKH